VIDRHGMRFREGKGLRPSGRMGAFEALGGSSSRIHVSVFDQGDIAEPSKRASSNAPGPAHREREWGTGAAGRKFARAQSEEVDDDVVSTASTASFRRRDLALDCAASQKQGSTRETISLPSSVSLTGIIPRSSLPPSLLLPDSCLLLVKVA
jgi:hypothetical protein